MKKKVSQNFIIIMCWLVYTLAYFGRYSYNSNITLIIDDYGITKAQAGLVATFFFFAYGSGQIINGVLSSRYNKKILFPIALTLSSLINLAVFFKVPFFTIKYLWLLNGFTQSCLWSGLVSVISKTIDDKHMTRAMLFMSTTNCVGTVVTYSFSSLFSFLNNYRISFIFAALVMTTLGIVWYFIYSPELEIAKSAEESEESKEKKNGIHGLVMFFVILAFFAVINNILKDGVTTWLPNILKERYNTSDSLSILLTIVLPILGMFGAMFSLRVNKYIKDFINLSSVLFIISAVAIGLVAAFSNMNVILSLLCFSVMICMMHGVNNILTSIVPLKMRDRIDSGKLAGIMNGFAYAGSTISSYGLGKIADIGGWQSVLNVLFAITIFTVLISLIYTLFNRQKSV